MTYSQDPKTRLWEIQQLTNAANALLEIRDKVMDIAGRRCPSSGKCHELSSIITILEGVENDEVF
jgi:hypothetical protein